MRRRMELFDIVSCLHFLEAIPELIKRKRRNLLRSAILMAWQRESEDQQEQKRRFSIGDRKLT